jgi:hypothetical protein
MEHERGYMSLSRGCPSRQLARVILWRRLFLRRKVKRRKCTRGDTKRLMRRHRRDNKGGIGRGKTCGR